VADTDEPTTPLATLSKEIKQNVYGIQLRDKQIALRLHRMVRIGMSHQQVTDIMGKLDVISTPKMTVKGHPSENADYFRKCEVAYTTKDTVTSVSHF
jgi:hypothetical protein